VTTESEIMKPGALFAEESGEPYLNGGEDPLSARRDPYPFSGVHSIDPCKVL
jgi:hypothetical protein